MRKSSLKRSGMARVNDGSHSFTCHPHVYPQVNIPYLPLLPNRRASPHIGWYSFSIPLRVESWVGLSGWLQMRWFTHPQMVTHPSTNRAQHRVTLLIDINTLPLSQARVCAANNFWTKWPTYLICWFILILYRSRPGQGQCSQSHRKQQLGNYWHGGGP